MGGGEDAKDPGPALHQASRESFGFSTKDRYYTIKAMNNKGVDLRG